MNTAKPSRPGPIDALAAGLVGAARRPWLLLVPLLTDLALWLAPPLSINTLMQRFLQAWEGLVRAAYSPAQLDLMADMLSAVREGITLLGQQVNLLSVLAGSWFSPPSLMASDQVTRLNFLSEMILAPAGVVLPISKPVASPLQGPPIEINALWSVLLIVAALWVVAQVVAVFWLRWASWGLDKPTPREGTTSAAAGWRDLPTQIGQLVAFCLVLGMLVFLLRLPLAFALALMLLSGNAVVGAVFALVGGVTLWIMLWLLISLYFTSEGLLFERQPLWRSMLQGAAMMRGNVLATLGLIALINLLLVGFRVVWGAIGTSPAGSVVAIVGNAYLATAMLLAIFSYYLGLRKYWLANQVGAAGSAGRTAVREETRRTGGSEGPTSKDE